MKTVTRDTMLDQLAAVTDPFTGDYDLDAIVGVLIERWGLCDLDDIPGEQFWGIVAEHDTADRQGQ